MEINEKLKVSDGMSAWIKDFQESDAPQFKDKSEKERREMAIAAYMSAKKGDMSESSLRKSIAQISGSFPERSSVKTKDGKSGTVLTVGKDFVKVAHGNKMKDYKPSELTRESNNIQENKRPTYMELLKLAGYKDAPNARPHELLKYKMMDLPSNYASAEVTKKFISLLDKYRYPKLNTGETTDHSYNPRDNLPLYQYRIGPGKVAVTVNPRVNGTGLPGWFRSDSVPYKYTKESVDLTKIINTGRKLDRDYDGFDGLYVDKNGISTLVSDLKRAGYSKSAEVHVKGTQRTNITFSAKGKPDIYISYDGQSRYADVSYDRRVIESVELDEAFTDKEIKMAYGILNDPRYKSGNLTKAVDKIEQIKKGLSKHPGVQKAMKATTESVDLDEGAVAVSTVEKDIQKNGGTNIKKDDKFIKFMYKGSEHKVALDKGFVKSDQYMKLQDMLEETELDENLADWLNKAKRKIGKKIGLGWKLTPKEMAKRVKSMENDELVSLYTTYHGTKISKASMETDSAPIVYNLVKREIERRFPGLDPTKLGKLGFNLDESSRNINKKIAELDEAVKKTEVKKVYSKKGNHIGTIYMVDNGRNKPYLSGLYHVNNTFDNQIQDSAKLEKWIQTQHERNLQSIKKDREEALRNLKKIEAEMKLIPEEVWKDIETYANKNGGIDKKDMLKVAMMLKNGDRKGAIKFASTLDTDPRDWLLDKMNENIEEATEINENNTKFTSADQWMAAALKAGKPAFMMSGKNIVALFDRNLRGEWQSAKGYGHLPTSILEETGLSEAFKSGDKVKIKNAKKYDSMSKDNVTGTVIGTDGSKVMVKVGSGQMNVDGNDLIKESVRMKSIEALIKEAKGGSGPRSMFVKDSGDDHIIMQLRSAQDLGGMKAIKFRGGKEGKVDKMDIDTVLKVHDMLSPEGKRKLRIMVSKSPADLVKAATELRKAMK